MRIYEVITELRKNPTLNPRGLVGHSAAVDFLDNIPRSNLIEYGVSMTVIDKVGINPMSNYKTPNGVYFYPAPYYLNLKQDNQELPFLNDENYIQIFKLVDPILDLENYTMANYNRDLERLITKLDSIENLAKKLNNIAFTGLSVSDDNSVRSIIEYIDSRKESEALINNPGGYIWFVTWKFSNYYNHVFKSKVTVLWQYILRDILGYNTVLDMGYSIIHKNEPYQGVVLKTSDIGLVKSIDNMKPLGKLRSDLRYMSYNSVNDLYLKRRISKHEIRQYVINNGLINDLLRYLIEHEPNWKYGRNKFIQLFERLSNTSTGLYNALKNNYSDFIDYFDKTATRWPELEKYIIHNAGLASYYALNVLHQRWPELEPSIDKVLDNWSFPATMYNNYYTSVMKYILTFKVKLSFEAEASMAVLGKDSRYNIDSRPIRSLYAEYVLNDTDPDTWGRRFIKQHPGVI